MVPPADSTLNARAGNVVQKHTTEATMRVLAIAALLALAACASREKYEAQLDTWLGQPKSALISSWGPPSRSYESGGKTYLTYDWSSSAQVGGTAPSYQTTIVGDTAYTNAYGGTPPTTVQMNCSTTFVVVDGRVREWRAQGNRCVAD
jgi:hypothetical protein